MKKYSSPNFNERSDGRIKYLILHYTGMASGKEAIDRLCDEAASVSAHYLIEEDGEVFSLVDENMRAWHAGISKWEDDEDINDLSIGIEIVNTGHSYPGYESVYSSFPSVQMDAVNKLALEIVERHKIKRHHVLGHSDVAWRRKIDPGELFDWERLSENGVGSWPSLLSEIDKRGCEVPDFLKKLKKYGYDVDDSLENPKVIISAFQRHFRQQNIDGVLDAETAVILDYLLDQKFN